MVLTRDGLHEVSSFIIQRSGSATIIVFNLTTQDKNPPLTDTDSATFTFKPDKQKLRDIFLHTVGFGENISLVVLVVIFHPPPYIRAALNTSDIFALLGPHCLDWQNFHHAATGLIAFTQQTNRLIGRDLPFFFFFRALRPAFRLFVPHHSSIDSFHSSQKRSTH